MIVAQKQLLAAVAATALCGGAVDAQSCASREYMTHIKCEHYDGSCDVAEAGPGLFVGPGCEFAVSDQDACRAAAAARSLPWYSYTAVVFDGRGPRCFFSSTCDNPVVGTGWEWRPHRTDGNPLDCSHAAVVSCSVNPFDCSGEPRSLGSDPAGITCASDPCTAAECCTDTRERNRQCETQ